MTPIILLLLISTQANSANFWRPPSMTAPVRVCGDSAAMLFHREVTFNCSHFQNFDQKKVDPTWDFLTYRNVKEQIHPSIQEVFRKMDTSKLDPKDAKVIENFLKSEVKDGLFNEDKYFFEKPISGLTHPLIYDPYENHFHFVSNQLVPNMKLRGAEGYTDGVIGLLAEEMVGPMPKDSREYIEESMKHRTLIAEKRKLLLDHFNRMVCPATAPSGGKE